MPGILGVIEKKPLPDASFRLRQMAECVSDRSANATGMLSLEKMGAHLGWASHPGSFADCLPAWNETGDICLIFSGENFTDRSEIDALRGKGHEFEDENASYLVHLYEEMGSGFLSKLNGCFSGVLVDLRKKTLVLFNDRYGLERVYFHENDDAFYFASEAKALLKVLPELRVVDPVALGEFFSCGCALQNRSLFTGVQLLPGAAQWTWQPGERLVRGAYFDPGEWENQPELPPAAFSERLSEIFTRIVPRYFGGPQAVAMSVTGGLDSRMIMAALRPPQASLPCYTFGGMLRDSADVKIGRSLAQACAQQFKVLPMAPDFFSQFPDLALQAVWRTDGAMDITGAANLYLNRLARQVAPVRMTGNYGGEILRGITALRSHRIDEGLFEPGLIPHLRKARDTIFSARRRGLRSFITFKQIPWHHFAMFAVEQSQLTVRTPYLDNELVALSYQAPPEFRNNSDVPFRYVADSDPRLASIPNDRGRTWDGGVHRDRFRSRLRNLREEFLPRAEYMFDYGMPGWLARIDRLLSPLCLERLFLGNQKFCHFRTWYRRELSGFVREILLDPGTLARPFLNRRRVEEVVSSHIDGTANHTLAIHKLLTCELLHRTLIEQNYACPVITSQPVSAPIGVPNC